MSTSSISNRKRHASAPLESVFDNTSAGRKKLAVKKEDPVLKEMMASAIIRHSLPLTIFEQSGDGDILTFLNPNVKPISTNEIIANCLEVYERERTKLRYALRSIPGRLCLTCDIWVDPCTNEYLCLTVNYVDSNWKLQNKFLNLVPLPFPWDASILRSAVNNLLCKWGIEKNVFSITFDSGRCGDTVLDMLRDCLNEQDGVKGDYFGVCCGAHFMDHMGQECFKLIDSPIRKIREGVQYVIYHEKNRLKFEEAAKLIFQGAFDPLWSDCKLRWNSTYLMLERSVKYRCAFEHVMIDDEYTDWHLTEEEWSRLEKMCKLLKPLYDIANLFLSTEHPTANLYFKNVLKIGLLLVDALEDKDLEISNLARRMKSEFDVYWDACHDVLALAIIFDPRYKLSFVKFCYGKLDKASAEDRYVSTCRRLDRLFKTYSDQVFASQTNEMKDDILKDFEIYCRKKEFDSSKSSLNVYLNEQSVGFQEHMDVLSWWKENEPRLGQDLSLMARDILSIPITSFPRGSVFGMGYRVEDRLKGMWSFNCMEVLIATRNWLSGYPVDADYPGGLMGREQRFWRTTCEEEAD
ncbi:hypothetical protein BVRB_2g028520 [Beta vulgaris subsp. vulgaris]|nr:hypothetical protein BVRB_2g028520 [Beta vulgaris subsp. vulgaris]